MNLNGLFNSSKKILLCLLVLMGKSEDQILVLLNLFLLDHLVIEEKLAEHNRSFIPNLETVSLRNDFFGPHSLVDGTSILLVDNIFVEDVDPILLRLLEVIINDKTSKTTAKCFHPLSDCLLGDIFSPIGLIIIIAIIPIVIVIRSVLLAILILLLLLAVLLLSKRFSLSINLLLRWVLDDEGCQLVSHVHDVVVPAGAAGGPDHVLLDLDDGLRVLAFLAEHKLLDEPIQHVLELASVVAAVDDVALSLDVELSLGPELAPEVLGDVGRGPREGPGHVHHVDDDRLDSIAFALNLGDKPRHLVPVERVLNIPVYVQSHDATLYLSLRCLCYFCVF